MCFDTVPAVNQSFQLQCGLVRTPIILRLWQEPKLKLAAFELARDRLVLGRFVITQKQAGLRSKTLVGFFYSCQQTLLVNKHFILNDVNEVDLLLPSKIIWFLLSIQYLLKGFVNLRFSFCLTNFFARTNLFLRVLFISFSASQRRGKSFFICLTQVVAVRLF